MSGCNPYPMSPEYLEKLADLADPRGLWRVLALDRYALSEEQRCRLDMGVALRRHASHIRELASVREEGRSLLITPISENTTAAMTVPIPDNHRKLFPDRKPN